MFCAWAAPAVVKSRMARAANRAGSDRVFMVPPFCANQALSARGGAALFRINSRVLHSAYSGDGWRLITAPLPGLMTRSRGVRKAGPDSPGCRAAERYSCISSPSSASRQCRRLTRPVIERCKAQHRMVTRTCHSRAVPDRCSRKAESRVYFHDWPNHVCACLLDVQTRRN